MDTQPHIENFANVGRCVRREGSEMAGADGKPLSPQTRHSAGKRKSENGGILRVSEGSRFAAKIALFNRTLETVGI